MQLRHCRWPGVELDVGELRDAIDSQEHMDLAVGRPQLAAVDVDVADLGLGKATSFRCFVVGARQARDAVTLETSMEATSRERGDALPQVSEEVVEGEQRPASELDYERLFIGPQHRTAPNLGRPSDHRRLSACAATWQPFWGSARNAWKGPGCSLSTLGARIEYAASFGRSREELLP